MENLKMVSLDTKCLYNEQYDFLRDNITDKFDYFMEEEFGFKYDDLKDVKIYGDVSYCQGRGIGIQGLYLGKEDIERILNIKIDDNRDVYIKTKTGGHYENYTVVEDECIWTSYDITEPEDFNRGEIVEQIEDWIEDIEKRLLKYGEEEMEYIETERLCQDAMLRFFEKNNIEANELYTRDMNYTTKKDEVKENMMQIADSGDTSLDGLWIELGELEEHKREKKTREDGQLISEKTEIFYTFK